MYAALISVYLYSDMNRILSFMFSLQDALPIWRPQFPGSPRGRGAVGAPRAQDRFAAGGRQPGAPPARLHRERARDRRRSEEHTSELQSPCNIVCRLLLEKKTDI